MDTSRVGRNRSLYKDENLREIWSVLVLLYALDWFAVLLLFLVLLKETLFSELLLKFVV